MSGADFTADRRLVWLSLLAIPVGGVCAAMALLLLRLERYIRIGPARSG